MPTGFLNGTGRMSGTAGDDEREIRARIEELRQEHRDLDSAIDALVAATPHDQIQVKRLKKRKLWLRDQLSKLEDLLIPDIIA